MRKQLGRLVRYDIWANRETLISQSRVFSEHLADAIPERLAEEVAGARSQLISEPPVRSLLTDFIHAVRQRIIE